MSATKLKLGTQTHFMSIKFDLGILNVFLKLSMLNVPFLSDTMAIR